jgi:glutamate-5-semialdehyde dehydrogenase
MRRSARSARRLRERTAELIAVNGGDVAAARDAGLAAPLVERLTLDRAAIETVALGCEQIAAMPDPIGDIVELRQQPSGIRVGRMRVPIGVFAMVYESRPNVTIEAASLAIKSGNACICAAAPEALASNLALAQDRPGALREAGLPARRGAARRERPTAPRSAT